jgi:hypothetical protein
MRSKLLTSNRGLERHLYTRDEASSSSDGVEDNECLHFR